MRAHRALSFALVALASCGTFLPWSGDDDDPPPAPAPSTASADGAAETSGDARADAFTVGDSATTCSPASSPCSQGCCAGLTCKANVCCVPGGQYANAAADCCDGTGKFEGIDRGWFCLETS